MAATGTSTNWMLAILASVALHVVVIGIAVATSSPGESRATEDREVVEANEESVAPQNVQPASDSPAASTREEPRQTTEAPRPQAPTAIPVPEPAFPEVYIVKQGDTLTKIAKIYGLTVDEIAEANGKSVKKMNILWVGQKIKLR